MPDYTVNLHKQFNFPLDILRNYIYERTGIKFRGFKKITDGIECEVYNIGRYIVKIRRKGEVPFDCIKWAVDKCKLHGIKVPDIVYCGRISDTAADFDIIIEETVQGSPAAPELYEQAGAELRKIHNIKVGGFWKMYEPGKFCIDINDGKIDVSDDYNNSLRGVIKYFRDENIYGRAEINYIERLLCEYLNLKISPVLCHGDYHPRHILGGKRLNGIIDWGDFQGGSGYVDLVNFQMYSNSNTNSNSDTGHFGRFFKGYGEIDEKEFLLNKVHTILWEIIENGDESEIKIKKAYERELLNAIKPNN